MDFIPSLALIAIILLVVFAVYRFKSKPKAKTSAPVKPATPVKPPKAEAASEAAPTSRIKSHTFFPPPEESGKPTSTLEEKYAAKHKLWICRYCETQNPASAACCAACGHNKR